MANAPASTNEQIVVPKVSKRAKKAAGPQLVPPVVDPLKAQIDRLGHLRMILAANAVHIAGMQAEEKALTAKLSARYESTPAEEIATAEGDLYVLKVGARANEQSVIAGGLQRVFELVGVEKFLAKAKLTFEALKALLTPDQYQEVVTSARTGRRNLTVVAKSAAGGPEKAA